MHKEWLQKKITKEQAEVEHMVSDPRLGPSPIAFGFNNGNWREFVAKMQDTDELWTFSSSDEMWKSFCGRAGIALVRRGEIIDSIVTAMN
jgi:hypothetical protein